MNNIKTVSFISTLVLILGSLNYAFAGEKELKTDTNRYVRKEYKAFKEEIENDESFTFKYLAFTKNSSAVTVEVKRK